MAKPSSIPTKVIERVTDGSRYISDPQTGCYIWTNAIDNTGYGKIGWYENGKSVTTHAHRVAAFATYGDPEGLEVMHRCQNRACCRPEHLKYGTTMENAIDRMENGNQLRGSKIHQSKLTEKDIPEIRHYLANGRTQAWIADKYGVAQARISEIKHNKAWRHV